METVTREPLGLSTRLPVYGWLPLEEIEPGAFEQIKATADHPDAVGHVAVMPDCHRGFGVAVGTAFVTGNAVVPNAVGVDIGCGMSALDTGVRFDPERMDARFWGAWMGEVRRTVPVGFNIHPGTATRLPEDLAAPLRAEPVRAAQDAKAARQFGTLGGGNHFLEAQVDEAGSLWLMVHSGSRRTGLEIAGHYHRIAVAQSAARGLAVGAELASLSADDGAYHDYLADMGWGDRFARGSRARMMRRMAEALAGLVGGRGEVRFTGAIDVPHNLAFERRLGDRPTVLHRKGATTAHAGELAIIPGSMGTGSFIVGGLGNPDSHESCSHGAGRTGSRGAARREFTLEQFEAALEGTFSLADARLLDESPMAYKPIETVIERQADLVEVVHRLRPLATVKGGGRDEG